MNDHVSSLLVDLLCKLSTVKFFFLIIEVIYFLVTKLITKYLTWFCVAVNSSWVLFTSFLKDSTISFSSNKRIKIGILHVIADWSCTYSSFTIVVEKEQMTWFTGACKTACLCVAHHQKCSLSLASSSAPHLVKELPLSFQGGIKQCRHHNMHHSCKSLVL